jgi:AraC-like DNA-binding protein
MRIVKAYNRIPQDCIERFIPSHILQDTIFSRMGIRHGGISTFHEGSFIKRPGNRDYHIVILTVSGAGSFTMEDDRSVIAVPGDIFFSHAGGQGHIHLPHTAPWIILWLQIESTCSWLIPPFEDWGIIPVSSEERALRLYGIQKSIIDEELYTHQDGNRVQQLYAELFMVYLQRELHIQQYGGLGRYQAKLNQLWQSIASSPDKPWLLKDMSKFAGMSRAQLYRLCLTLYRKPPGEKVREIKMEHAQALLRHFDCQVTEAAERVGYENTSNFSAAFKKHFGYPPRETACPRPQKRKGFNTPPAKRAPG